jgi:hypothetical protein
MPRLKGAVLSRLILVATIHWRSAADRARRHHRQANNATIFPANDKDPEPWVALRLSAQTQPMF